MAPLLNNNCPGAPIPHPFYPISDHEALGSNPTWGGAQFMTVLTSLHRAFHYRFFTVLI